MAQIHGIELKGMKTFLDHEGARIAQGNLYVEGKKVAEWSQDSWGGPDIFRMSKGYSEEALNNAIKKVHPQTKKCETYGGDFELDYDADLLMGDLVVLTHEEKDYKKFAKSGYPTLCTITDGFASISWGIRSTTGLTESLKSKLMTQAKQNGIHTDSATLTLKTSLADFIVGEPIKLADIKA